MIKFLKLLPILLYFECIILYFVVLFYLDWYLKYNLLLQIIDWVLCFISAVYALKHFKSYSHFAKSCTVALTVTIVFAIMYYFKSISYKTYTFFYILTLASNLYYIGLRMIIKP